MIDPHHQFQEALNPLNSAFAPLAEPFVCVDGSTMGLRNLIG
ncbi:hypothetical protein OG897_30240 [Streptomyces sp. NBC_00237]|nr:hypothetical protein [Streptomyces sp. NBC_00237]MCX5205719.1 hypothetical protein [Streptomyces sp. NBC_00237]